MNAVELLIAPTAGLGGQPPWLTELRRVGHDAFVARGLPTPRDEEWKYTNVSALTRTPFALVGTERFDASLLGDVPSLGGPRLVFANGRYDAALSTPTTASGPVFVGSLEDAIERVPDLVREHLGSLLDLPRQPFAALNTAFLEQGAVIHVGRGVQVPAPIEVVFVSDGASATMAHPRILLVTEPGARVELVERYIGSGVERYLTNVVTEIVVAAEASVGHLRLQEEATSSFHFASVFAHQAAASRFASTAISFGAAMARADISAVLDGPGAECHFDGLYLARGTQHVDHQTVIDHRVPHGTSRELYKGVLDDASTGVFGGKVYVREDAQKSDAQQMNKNLLLSDAATVDTKPQLEIFADDVKCSHGATIGRLDDAALFYLRSRGIEAAEAREMLIRAFANEMVERVPIAALRADLALRLDARFDSTPRRAAA